MADNTNEFAEEDKTIIYTIPCLPEFMRKESQDKIKTELAYVLSELPELEQHVIIMRFGLITNTPMTYEETGEALGIPEEEVRQLECDALRRMRRGRSE